MSSLYAATGARGLSTAIVLSAWFSPLFFFNLLRAVDAEVPFSCLVAHTKRNSQTFPELEPIMQRALSLHLCHYQELS